MLTALSNAFTSMIGFVAQVVQQLVGENGSLAELLPLFVIGISISLLLVCFKLIRKITWGA